MSDQRSNLLILLWEASMVFVGAFILRYLRECTYSGLAFCCDLALVFIQ